MARLRLKIKTVASESGWTTFTPSGDSRLVYVSTSDGNDEYDGLSPSTPKASLAAAMGLLRDGYPDWLQLKCGDEFTDSFGNWTLSGRSSSERMLITNYGSGARPSEDATWVDATRTVAKYNATQGGAETFAAFVANVRANRKGAWNSAFTAHAVNEYIRAGLTKVT